MSTHLVVQSSGEHTARRDRNLRPAVGGIEHICLGIFL